MFYYLMFGSKRDSSSTGTVAASPLILSLYSGMTLTTAGAAPVVNNTMLSRPDRFEKKKIKKYIKVIDISKNEND